jgi:hypothetical protein
MRKQRILPRDVIWPFLLCFWSSFGILLAWTLIHPSKFSRLEVGLDGFVDPISVPTCTYETGFQSALQVALFLSFAMVFYMSRNTRDLPENRTDSRRISKVLLSHVLVTLGKLKVELQKGNNIFIFLGIF